MAFDVLLCSAFSPERFSEIFCQIYSFFLLFSSKRSATVESSIRGMTKDFLEVEVAVLLEGNIHYSLYI